MGLTISAPDPYPYHYYPEYGAYGYYDGVIFHWAPMGWVRRRVRDRRFWDVHQRNYNLYHHRREDFPRRRGGNDEPKPTPNETESTQDDVENSPEQDTDESRKHRKKKHKASDSKDIKELLIWIFLLLILVAIVCYMIYQYYYYSDSDNNKKPGHHGHVQHQNQSSSCNSAPLHIV